MHHLILGHNHFLSLKEKGYIAWKGKWVYEYNPSYIRGIVKKYGYYVPFKEIGYESYLFYRREIDEDLVPAAVIDHLVEPFQTGSANYTAAEDNYYVVIQVEIGNVEPYVVWLGKGVVDKHFLEETNEVWTF